MSKVQEVYKGCVEFTNQTREVIKVSEYVKEL